MQSQGTKREAALKNSSKDKEQLERSAEMFEMILQSAPDAVQNYLALKDIYRELNKGSDFKRIAKGLAQVYLDSSQPDRAAKEYAEILDVDPNDAEALSKLEGIGYARTDLPALRAEVELQEIRARCQQKLQELEEAEKAFLKLSAKARDARRGEDEETRRVLKGVEERTDSETQRLVSERERWLREGRTEVFNQVAESLKKKADGIIQEDESNDIRRSVRRAEKILASTDKVFEEEWHRLSEEREKDFHRKIENLKRRSETELRSAWQEVVASAEQDLAAADLELRKVKEELRQLQTLLRDREKVLQRSKKDSPEQPLPSRLEQGPERPEVVVIAPNGLRSLAEPPEETMPEPSPLKTARDEVGKALGAILVQHGLVSRERLEEAIAKQGKDYRPIGEILVESGYASEEDIINALVAQSGVPYLPLANYEISEEVAMMIPMELALKYALMPADRIGNTLLVAMGIPLNREQKEEVQQHVKGMKVSYFISSWSDIKGKHEQHYM